MERLIRSSNRNRICSLPSFRLCVGTLSNVSPVRWLGATGGYNSAGRSVRLSHPGLHLVSDFHPDALSRLWASRLAAARVQRTWTCRCRWMLVKAQTDLYSLRDENLRDPSFAVQTTIDESRNKPTGSKQGALSPERGIEFSSFSTVPARPEKPPSPHTDGL